MTVKNSPNNSFCIPKSDLPKIVIIGAGFAGINLIKKLENKPVQIILIDQNNFHQFQPLLYQVAISGLEPDAIISPVRKLFKSCVNILYRMAEVTSIDTKISRVQTNIGFVDYDFLVVATGSSTNFYGSESIERNSIGLKSIHDALDIRSWMLQNLEKAVDGCNFKNSESLTRFIIVGGGPAGVEMAGALAEFKKFMLKSDYPEIKPESMKVSLIQAGERVLPTMSEKSSKHALKVLEKLDVEVLLNSRVEDYDGDKIIVLTKDGKEIINTNTVIWTAGVKGNTLEGLPKEALVPGNRIKVNTHSQIEGLENVFAIGDVAAMITEENPKGHPMVAQVAIQQGRTLAKNILSTIETSTLSKEFIYKDKGSMATIGKKNAVADLKIAFLNGKLGWILWSFIHLISITGFKNRFKVGFSWIMKYFSYDKANQLIVRKYNRK